MPVRRKMSSRKVLKAVEEVEVKLGESDVEPTPASWSVVVVAPQEKEHLWFKLESTNGRGKDYPITVRVKRKDALRLASVLCESVIMLSED